MQRPTLDQIAPRLQGGVKQALQAGASAAKILFSRGETISCNFEGGRLKDTGGGESVNFGIEVLRNGLKGNTSGNRLEDLDSLVARAVAFAANGSVAHFESYPAPGQITQVVAHSERTRQLSRERLIEACQEMADMLRAYDPDLFVTCSASRSTSEGLVVTSGGVCHPSQRTSWSLGTSVQRTRGTDMLFAGDGRGWCDVNELFDPRKIAEGVLTDLRAAERMAKPPSGRIKAFIPADRLAMYLWPVLMGINGRNVAKGDSPLAGKLGQQILAPAFTLTDNPHLTMTGGAAEMDHDGIPTRRQTLVENGVLQRFLYDLDSAGLAKVDPTGNEDCSPYWLTVKPGEVSSHDLLAGVQDGLYVKDLIGYGQSNIINGDFSCNVGLGYRIENGELVGRVKDTMIAGNIYALLSGDLALSSDLEHEGRFPAVLLDGLNVSSKV